MRNSVGSFDNCGQNRVVYPVLLCLLGIGIVCVLQGCAAGRNDATGEIVIGFGAGKLTESANQAIAQLGDMAIPGAGGALGLLGVAGLGWARSHAAAKSREAAAAAEARAWAEAEAERKQRDRDRLMAMSDPALVTRAVGGIVPASPTSIPTTAA